MNPYVVTPEGQARMRARLRAIKEVDRPQNVRDIETALEHGDLRENAEYHAAKERQSFLQGEMQGLEDKLSRTQVVDPSTLSGDRVVFGATVVVLNLDTDVESKYSIVGEDDGDLSAGRISYKSPLARALIGKEEGDAVMFQAPGGKKKFEIVEVTFE
ncbi:MAG: transcription elongation factor GreA [Myxococcota bacterium]|jgi:transcription elongation factor GreA